MTFDDLLHQFKAQPRREAVLQLLLDMPLLRYTGLWHPTLVRRVHDWTMGEDWNDLWECVTVDYKALGDLMDEPEGRARHQVARLRQMQLIYPDGTVPELATKAITKFMVDRLS